MNNYTIYLHKNKINGKYYIGQTNQKVEYRWGKEGKNYNKQPKFYRAIKKYGWDNFEHKILEKNLSQEEANKKEKYYINLYNSYYNGYNGTEGGKNRQLSEQEKIKISLFMKEKQKGKNNTQAKAVICLNTMQYFDTIKEASEWANVAPENIGAVCHNRTKTAGNFNNEPLCWCFYSEFNEENYEAFLKSKEMLVNNSKRPRMVAQLDINTLEIINTFNNCSLAAEKILGNKKRGNKIQEAIKRNGTAYGYKWRYINE